MRVALALSVAVIAAADAAYLWLAARRLGRRLSNVEIVLEAVLKVPGVCCPHGIVVGLPCDDCADAAKSTIAEQAALN